jgi:nitrogen fixation protein FixH
MKKLTFTLILTIFSVFFAACGAGGGSATSGKVVKETTANNLKITLAAADGVLRDGKNEFTIAFADASGNPVKMDAVAVNFHMPAMGTMPVMNDAATVTSSGTPGVYKGTVNLQMAGEWQTQVSYEGAAGKGKAVLPIVAQ